jgi:hypothetical protein
MWRADTISMGDIIWIAAEIIGGGGMRGWRWAGLGVLLLTVQSVMAAPTVFTYRAAESALDSRNHYDIALLQLALDETRHAYGDYQLNASPPMNTARSMQELEKGTYPNFIVKQSYNPDFEPRGMLRGSYDVDLGVIGYRVCFTRPALLPQLAGLNSLEGWQHYVYGQGSGWMDINILKYNGFQVMEVPLYKNLFPMVARGRFDLFCRGINEVSAEWSEAQQQGLVLEPNVMLYYDLPRFFYANPHDAEGLARIEAGIRLAAADGSLLTLWKQYYLPSVKLIRPETRRLFRLVNPVLSQLKWADKQLVFDPQSGAFHYREP